jgi:hypothetical protein
MTRTIYMRPEKYYGRAARYSKRRATLAADQTIKWFWMRAEMRFTRMKEPAGRILRFSLCPGKYPHFKY